MRPIAAWAALSVVLLTGCAQSHARTEDGAVALGSDGSDASASGSPAPEDSVPCGPNRCYDGEVCCHAECGLCTDPDACIPTLACVETETVCGGVVCSAPTGPGGFCCPTCEDERCPPPGVHARAACPPVSCE